MEKSRVSNPCISRTGRSRRGLAALYAQSELTRNGQRRDPGLPLSVIVDCLYIVFLRNILRFIAILLKAVFHGYRRHSQGLGQSGSPRDSRVAEGAQAYFSEQAFSLANGVCA